MRSQNRKENNYCLISLLLIFAIALLKSLRHQIAKKLKHSISGARKTSENLSLHTFKTYSLKAQLKKKYILSV